MANSIVDNNAIISLIDDAIADSLGPDWTSYDAAHHVMQWLTDAGLQVVPVPAPTAKPFAYCCAEAGGDPQACDCATPQHGTAIFEATCLMVNCRNRAPADEAFCAKHRRP